MNGEYLQLTALRQVKATGQPVATWVEQGKVVVFTETGQRNFANRTFAELQFHNITFLNEETDHES